MPQVKQAISINLPVRKGEKAIIMLAPNMPASTSVRNILSVSYNQQYMFITIESKNSIYKDIPVPVNPAPNFYDGQIIEPGQSVYSSFGTSLKVSEITEVTKEGIGIKDVTGREYFGDIRAVEQK